MMFGAKAASIEKEWQDLSPLHCRYNMPKNQFPSSFFAFQREKLKLRKERSEVHSER